MDPRFEARIASVALERREILLRQLGCVIRHLSSLSGISVIERLVVGFKFLEAQLTVATLSVQEIRTIGEQLTPKMDCIFYEILLPLLEMIRTTEDALPLAATRPQAAMSPTGFRG
jgi:hypothetical protein